MFKNKSILITGGTGSFGKKFVKTILKNNKDLKKLIIFSRDELKQYEMARNFPQQQYPSIRFFIGDVRDKERLETACKGVDYIIHAAALKQVPAAEYNPIEFIKTNILGSENLIHAAIKNNIKKVVALSTDKAAAPINMYGASKLVSDKLLIAGNHIKGNRDLSFTAVRYGNVMGSRGSVIPFFIKEAANGYLPITNPEMTRFNITLAQAVEMVIWAINNSIGGEIFVPKIPSYLITDLAEAIGPNCKKNIVGIRNGEKIHEEMITYADSFNTYDIDKYFVIIQPSNEIEFERFHKSFKVFKPIEKGFSYNSQNNKDFLTIEQLRKLIKENVDINFIPK